MSKKAARKKTPEQIADRVLSKYLSPDSIYCEILDEVMEDDFVAMEDAIMGDVSKIDRRITSVEAQREIARQEACFLLGLEIGKRIGGSR